MTLKIDKIDTKKILFTLLKNYLLSSLFFLDSPLIKLLEIIFKHQTFVYEP